MTLVFTHSNSGNFYYTLKNHFPSTQVYQFTHENVEQGEVIYIQTDLSSYWDSFQFILYDSQNMLTNQKINITVTPNVKQKPMVVEGEDSFMISTSVLDAGILAASTGSNPEYTVLNQPKYGKGIVCLIVCLFFIWFFFFVCLFVCFNIYLFRHLSVCLGHKYLVENVK